MIIGAQLYTVRAFCKDLDSFAETLEKIADIGYTAVQVSGTCDFEPEWLKAQLDKAGLRCVLTHTPVDQLKADPFAAGKKHDIFGCKNVGLGYFKFSKEDGHSYEDFKALITPMVEGVSRAGKYFMYHNHASEFSRSEGKVILERIAEDFPGDKLGFTPDTYWIQAGGGDPAQWIEKLSGRVPCIHLKDFAFDGDKKMAVVGEGNINFDRVFLAAEAAGTEYMLVEQDDCYGEDPFACLARSYDYLRSRGFK